ncbi:MAG: methyltransferase domain-containing protein [Deltaproteobacteria bacterium]|nr:methyltransferase domain-containing protein [Deltaproteobacteria bacterium]
MPDPFAAEGNHPPGPIDASTLLGDPAVLEAEDPIWRQNWVPIDNANRDGWETTRRVLEALAPHPGERVGDLGAGGGYFTFQVARRVGPTGMVFAQDINPTLMRKVAWEARHRGVSQVRAAVTRADSLGLEAHSVDALLMTNVYLFDRCRMDMNRRYMEQAWRALRPGGRFVILHDFIHTSEWSGGNGQRICDQLTPEAIAGLQPSRFREVHRSEVRVPGTYAPGELPGYLLVLRRVD